MIAKPKHQRLLLIVIAAIAVGAAVLLAMWGLRDRAAYFYTPSDIAAGKATVGEPARLGGMVTAGSVERLPDGVTVRFRVGDGAAEVPVRYRGILPDLFQENSGAVAEGRLASDGTFIAQNILAKHDERYMPPELGNDAAEREAGRTIER
jgi:cytochrome c-type biogenesis protein CcmE